MENPTLEHSVAARYRRVLPAWAVTWNLVAWAMVLAGVFLQPIVPVGVAIGSLLFGALGAVAGFVACARRESRGKLAVTAVVLNLGYWGFLAYRIVLKLMA